MSKENLLNAKVGTIVKIEGEISSFSKHLLIPRTDEERKEEEQKQRQLGWKYPKAYRIEANIDNPRVLCKVPKQPDEAELYLGGKIFQRKEKDADGNDTGEMIKSFSIQSQGLYAPKLGVKGEDGKIHQVNLETGEIAGEDRKIEIPSKILLAGQKITATYKIIETKNGKTASLMNLVLDEDPKFFIPARQDDAGEDWDNVERTDAPKSTKVASNADAAPAEAEAMNVPVEEDDSDQWA